MFESILPIIELFFRILLAIIFAGAAISKLRNRGEFHGIVRNFRLLPESVDGIFAATLPWAELAIAGLLLIGGGVTAYSGAAAAALLLVFASAIAINIARGRREIDCGCYRDGPRQGLSWFLVARNFVLASAALFVASQPTMPGLFSLAHVALATAAAAVSVVLYLCAAQLQAMRPRH